MISAREQDEETRDEEAEGPVNRGGNEGPEPHKAQVPCILMIQINDDTAENDNQPSPLIFGSVNPARIPISNNDDEIVATEPKGFDPLADRNVTRRVRREQPLDYQGLGGASHTGHNVEVPQDV